MRAEDVPALLSETGRRLLEEVTAARAEGADPLALGSRLRRRHDPGLVAAATAQADLRRRAVTKLGPQDAARMLFTPEALEQATPAAVAALRARRMAGERPAGRPLRVVDLGCGVGSDLVALARAGVQVTGVEHDEVRAAMARANLRALGLPGEVVHGDLAEVALDDFDAVFCDPARRDGRGRVFDPAAYSPPWSLVEHLLATRAACVKVSPALPHRLVPAGVEAEWVSEHGEVKEAALWSRPWASEHRRATVLPSATGVADSGAVAETGPVGDYLYEPDGAVIRAGLVAELAEPLGAHLLDRRIAYLTGDHAVASPLARCFAVVAELPYREKALRAALRARDVGRLTVKKRGVEVAPETLRRRLALRGSRPATVVLTRARGSALALLVEEVSSPAG